MSKFVTLLVELQVTYDWIHESDDGVKYYNIYENNYIVTREDGNYTQPTLLHNA